MYSVIEILILTVCQVLFLHAILRGVERHVLSFHRFPAALLGCGTGQLYASCFVVQPLGDLYENVSQEDEFIIGSAEAFPILCMRCAR